MTTKTGTKCERIRSVQEGEIKEALVEAQRKAGRVRPKTTAVQPANSPAGHQIKLVNQPGTPTFQLGTEMNPRLSDVQYLLNRMVSMKYLEEYKLLPPGYDMEVLSAFPAKEVVHSVVPLLVSNIERKVMAGIIDVYSVDNKSLIVITAVLAWYWHRNLGGPRPLVDGLLKLVRPPVNPDLNFSCPICTRVYFPPKNLVQLSARAWSYWRWLEVHFQECHQYSKPKGRIMTGSDSHSRGKGTTPKKYADKG